MRIVQHLFAMLLPHASLLMGDVRFVGQVQQRGKRHGDSAARFMLQCTRPFPLIRSDVIRLT